MKKISDAKEVIGGYPAAVRPKVARLRTLFPELHVEGNRALVFDLNERLPEDAVATCIELALTYHSRKRRARRSVW